MLLLCGVLGTPSQASAQLSPSAITVPMVSVSAIGPTVRGVDSTIPSVSADAVTTDEAQTWGVSSPASQVAQAAPVAEEPLKHLAHTVISRTTTIAASLTRSAMRFIGTPYVFGGTSPSGFDCSGYVQHVFAMLGIHIPRTADAQYYAGQPIEGRMHRGDLVFFQTYLPGPSHVGIYLGGGKFVHASSHGVMVSSLGDHYWHVRYIGAKRMSVSTI